MHKVQVEYDVATTQQLFGIQPNPMENLILRIGNRMDDVRYIQSVWLGLAVSALALLLTAWLLVRWYLRQRRLRSDPA